MAPVVNRIGTSGSSDFVLFIRVKASRPKLTLNARCRESVFQFARLGLSQDFDAPRPPSARFDFSRPSTPPQKLSSTSNSQASLYSGRGSLSSFRHCARLTNDVKFRPRKEKGFRFARVAFNPFCRRTWVQAPAGFPSWVARPVVFTYAVFRRARPAWLFALHSLGVLRHPIRLPF